MPMPPTATLKVHETTTEGGGLEPVLLHFDGGVLSISGPGPAVPLPDGALAAVLARFGAPVEPSESLIAVGALPLWDGHTLRHVRHLARYDVIARDYLVYESPGSEPRCALATTVAGALAHLARASAPK